MRGEEREVRERWEERRERSGRDERRAVRATNIIRARNCERGGRKPVYTSFESLFSAYHGIHARTDR